MDDYIKDFQRAFGVYVYLRRKRLGLKQTEVSERSGIRRTEISALEVGRNVNPNLITILKLLYALDLEIDIKAKEDDKHE